ncbi:MAG: hypothetical protein ACYC2Y_03645 [Armatimonadota bacterium]
MEDLVRKSYRTIALTWGVVILWVVVLGKAEIAASLTAGTALQTALLFAMDVFVRAVFVPGAARPKRALLVFAVLKLPLVGLVIFALIRWGHMNPIAFVGGILLVHFALVAKLVGIRLVERRES